MTGYNFCELKDIKENLTSVTEITKKEKEIDWVKQQLK